MVMAAARRRQLPRRWGNRPRQRESAQDWWERALCQQYSTELFFSPQRRSSGSNINWKVPRAICGACPVREDCLRSQVKWEWGVPVQYRHGMFGGATPADRVLVENSLRGRGLAAAER